MCPGASCAISACPDRKTERRRRRAVHSLSHVSCPTPRSAPWLPFLKVFGEQQQPFQDVLGCKQLAPSRLPELLLLLLLLSVFLPLLEGSCGFLPRP